jgi:hypothetical protein
MTDSTSPAPAVWTWYLAYAIALAVVYWICVAAGIALLVFNPAQSSGEMPTWLTGGILIGMGVPFGLAFSAAPFLPKRPWAWVYHLVAICIGMTSACCMPACIPLLIYWLKPETKAMFGKP